MNRVISPGDRVLVTPYVSGFTRKAYKATVIEWTPRGKLKVKKDVDDKTVIVSPEDVKKLADGKVVEANQPDEKAGKEGDETSKTVLLYLPR